jgi:hypothetical protein
MPERLPRWAIVVMLTLVVGALALVGPCVTAGPAWETARIDGVTASTSSRELSVLVGHASCNAGPRVRILREDADAVRIVAEQGTDCEDIGLHSTVDIDLTSPLRARTVETQQSRYVTERELDCTIDGERSSRCVEVRVPD